MKKVQLLVGIVMIATALFTYIPQTQYMYELTFLSNLSGGCLLIANFIMKLKCGKSLPKFLFLALNVTLFTVSLIAVGCTLLGIAHFNFQGGMFFLHIINPIVVMVLYIVSKGEEKLRVRNIFYAPLFLLAFLAFDYIRFLFVGSLIYGLIPEKGLSFAVVLAIGLSAYILIWICGLLIELLADWVKRRQVYKYKILKEIRMKG